mgnify:CR=1 FL=1
MYKLFAQPLVTRSWPTAARYGVTLVMVLAALAATEWLQPHMNGHTFTFFYAAVVAAGVMFNHGSSIVALLTSAVLADYFFLDPVGSFDIGADIVPWLAFVAICLVIGIVVKAMHVAVHHLHAANRALASSDSEKDLLLREATHRTRNDLQMLGALIDLQMRASDNALVRNALSATRGRVRLLGEVQQRLRRTQDNTVVDMRDFITGLCDDLRHTLFDLHPITLTLQAEQHDLSQEQAVAVGLVINELATNALKYAFPDGRQGHLRIGFVRQDSDYVVTVEDDGIGAATARPQSGTGTHMGQRLLRALAAQLHGEIAVETRDGTIATLRFPVVS